MSLPDLSVVVVTHNGRDKAMAALESAHASTGAISVEWLVVDSGSSDGTPDAIAARWPQVKLRRRANIGFAAGNNVALEQASGRYVLLMNPDVEILDGTFEDLVAALDERPDVGAASVVQRSPAGEILPSIGRFPTGLRQFGEALLLKRVPGLRHLQEMETRPKRYLTERSADWVVGAFLVARREAVEQIGGLDERFFLYSEEKDWCYRMRQAGWDIRHLPTLAVLHHTGGYSKPGMLAQLTHSKLLFARKHFGLPRRAGIRAGLVARHAARAGRGANEREALTRALGRGESPFAAPAAPEEPNHAIG